jgi:hypothetical protein
MKAILFKILTDTVLKNLILQLAKEGAKRTSTPYDDLAVEVVEKVLSGDVIDVITKDNKK